MGWQAAAARLFGAYLSRARLCTHFPPGDNGHSLCCSMSQDDRNRPSSLSANGQPLKDGNVQPESNTQVDLTDLALMLSTTCFGSLRHLLHSSHRAQGPSCSTLFCMSSWASVRWDLSVICPSVLRCCSGAMINLAST